LVLEERMSRRDVLTVVAALAVVLVLVAISIPKFANTKEKARAAAARAAARDLASPAPATTQPSELPREQALARARSASLLRLPTPADLEAQVPADTARLLIRTGSIGIEVDSLESAVEQVRRVAAAVGGYVANASARTTEFDRSASLELKVPAARFEATVERLRAIGRVEAVNVSVEDVGEEYVDAAARMANAQRLEARLLELLTGRAGRLTDVLEVERELARVREQVERYAGRLQLLRQRAALSTLTVQLHEPGTVVGRQPGLGVVGEAFGQAWVNFIYFMAFLVKSLGVLVPLGALAWGGWWAAQKLGKRPA
jgi:hypothetical protein